MGGRADGEEWGMRKMWMMDRALITATYLDLYWRKSETSRRTTSCTTQAMEVVAVQVVNDSDSVTRAPRPSASLVGEFRRR